jgi:hypothetical protein
MALLPSSVEYFGAPSKPNPPSCGPTMGCMVVVLYFCISKKDFHVSNFSFMLSFLFIM